MNEQNENINKKDRNHFLSKKILELKNTITELENSIEEFDSCLDQASKQAWRQFVWNYWVRGANKKRNEENQREPKGLGVHSQGDQDIHQGFSEG